jgi:hypothetical protein
MTPALTGFRRSVQADDAVDELQQWHAAARAAAGMWAVVGLLSLLLALHVTTAPYVEQWLPSLLRIVPTMLYAGLVPVLSRHVLRPVCRWLNSLEKHSTKVNHCSNLVSPDFLLYQIGKGTLPVIVANVVCVILSPSTFRTGSGFTVSAKRWFVAWRFCAALPSIYLFTVCVASPLQYHAETSLVLKQCVLNLVSCLCGPVYYALFATDTTAHHSSSGRDSEHHSDGGSARSGTQRCQELVFLILAAHLVSIVLKTMVLVWDTSARDTLEPSLAGTVWCAFLRHICNFPLSCNCIARGWFQL